MNIITEYKSKTLDDYLDDRITLKELRALRTLVTNQRLMTVYLADYTNITTNDKDR